MLDQSYHDKADEIVASNGAYQESLIRSFRYPERISLPAARAFKLCCGKIGTSEAKA